MKKTIVCDGDSWVFGAEIVDPELEKANSEATHVTQYDFMPSNDLYRHNKIFPYYLGELMDADVINLAYPADDNGTILRRTIDFITTNYISKNKPTDDLLVIVGWSSPERNSFWFRDEETNISMNWRLWPNVKHFDHPAQEEMWYIYVNYLWHREEYLVRYIHNVMMLQNFCKAHNIDWLCFNSFYQTPNANITEWNDFNVKEEIKYLSEIVYQYQELFKTPFARDHQSFNYALQWDLIDSDRFYRKDEKGSTFRSYIVANVDEPFNNWHPSPKGHYAWAEELCRYIKERNIIS